MKANTAVGLVLTGVALCLLDGQPSRHQSRIGQTLAWVVALLGFAVRNVHRTTTRQLRGMVLKVDASRRSFVISHESIPGVMDAMTMALDVGAPNELDGVTAGSMVEFTLVARSDAVFAEA